MHAEVERAVIDHAREARGPRGAGHRHAHRRGGQRL
jgi:hypothetical protein